MPICSSLGSRGRSRPSGGLAPGLDHLLSASSSFSSARASQLKPLTPTPTRLQRLPQRLSRLLRRRVSFCIASTSFGPPCSSSTMAPGPGHAEETRPGAFRPPAGSSRGTGAAASPRAASCGLRGAFARSPSWERVQPPAAGPFPKPGRPRPPAPPPRPHAGSSLSPGGANPDRPGRRRRSAGSPPRGSPRKGRRRRSGVSPARPSRRPASVSVWSSASSGRSPPRLVPSAARRRGRETLVLGGRWGPSQPRLCLRGPGARASASRGPRQGALLSGPEASWAGRGVPAAPQSGNQLWFPGRAPGRVGLF